MAFNRLNCTLIFINSEGVWGDVGLLGDSWGFLGFPCVFPYIYGDFRLFRAVSGCFRVFQGVSGVVGGKLGGIVTYTGSLVDFLSLNVRGYPKSKSSSQKC